MAPRAKPAPAAQEPERVREPIREARQTAADAMPIIPGRVVAYNRAGKPIQRAGAETGVDQLHIPPHLPPEGWSWEWKRETVHGQPDAMYMSQMHQVGWEPVMYESYPGTFAPAFDDGGKETKGPVRRGGLILMERPAALTEEAFLDAQRKAKERVASATAQYNRLDTRGAPTAEFDLSAQRASYIRTQTETVASPPTDGRRPPGANPTRQSVD